MKRTELHPIWLQHLLTIFSMSSCPIEYFVSPETPSFNLHVISLLISSFSIPYSYFLLSALGNIANELTQLDFMA